MICYADDICNRRSGCKSIRADERGLLGLCRTADQTLASDFFNSIRDEQTFVGSSPNGQGGGRGRLAAGAGTGPSASGEQARSLAGRPERLTPTDGPTARKRSQVCPARRRPRRPCRETCDARCASDRARAPFDRRVGDKGADQRHNRKVSDSRIERRQHSRRFPARRRHGHPRGVGLSGGALSRPRADRARAGPAHGGSAHAYVTLILGPSSANVKLSTNACGPLVVIERSGRSHRWVKVR